MTGKTSHYFFGAQTAVLLAAAGLAAASLVLAIGAASAGARTAQDRPDTDKPPVLYLSRETVPKSDPLS